MNNYIFDAAKFLMKLDDTIKIEMEKANKLLDIMNGRTSKMYSTLLDVYCNLDRISNAIYEIIK